MKYKYISFLSLNVTGRMRLPFLKLLTEPKSIIIVTFITNNFQRMKIISNDIFLLVNKLAAVEELSNQHKGNSDQLLASAVTRAAGVFLFKSSHRVIF